MKIFDKDRKVNFVDVNNVLVGFDSYQSCCEQWGYFFSEQVPKDVQSDENVPPDLDDYMFDANYMNDAVPTKDRDTSLVTFRLVNGNKEMFLTLHNTHNGYYSHGFEIKVGGATIQEGSL